jgi:hypothetical protein
MHAWWHSLRVRGRADVAKLFKSLVNGKNPCSQDIGYFPDFTLVAVTELLNKLVRAMELPQSPAKVKDVSAKGRARGNPRITDPEPDHRLN